MRGISFFSMTLKKNGLVLAVLLSQMTGGLKAVSEEKRKEPLTYSSSLNMWWGIDLKSRKAALDEQERDIAFISTQLAKLPGYTTTKIIPGSVEVLREKLSGIDSVSTVPNESPEGVRALFKHSVLNNQDKYSLLAVDPRIGGFTQTSSAGGNRSISMGIFPMKHGPVQNIMTCEHYNMIPREDLLGIGIATTDVATSYLQELVTCDSFKIAQLMGEVPLTKVSATLNTYTLNLGKVKATFADRAPFGVIGKIDTMTLTYVDPSKNSITTIDYGLNDTPGNTDKYIITPKNNLDNLERKTLGATLRKELQKEVGDHLRR